MSGYPPVLRDRATGGWVRFGVALLLLNLAFELGDHHQVNAGGAALLFSVIMMAAAAFQWGLAVYNAFATRE